MGAIDTLAVSDQIQALFLGYFGHGALDFQLEHWDATYERIIDAGHTPDRALHRVAHDLSEKPAAEALYPLLSAPSLDLSSPAIEHRVATTVDHIWDDLYGHGPSAGAQLYWDDRVLSGAVPLSELVEHIENHAHGANATTLLGDIADADTYAATYMSGGVGLTIYEAPAPTGQLVVVGVSAASLAPAYGM